MSLTCVPNVVKQHISTGHKKQPVQWDKNQTKDIQGEGGADKHHADDLGTERDVRAPCLTLSLLLNTEA